MKIQDAIERIRSEKYVCGVMFIAADVRRVYHGGVDAPWSVPLDMVEMPFVYAEGAAALFLAQWRGRATVKICGMFNRCADGSEPVGGKPFPWIGGAIIVE